MAYSRIASELFFYVGSVFEHICKQYLRNLLLGGRCVVNFSDIGRWWGVNPKTKFQEGIDIMGMGKGSALSDECKRTRENL